MKRISLQGRTYSPPAKAGGVVSLGKTSFTKREPCRWHVAVTSSKTGDYINFLPWGGEKMQGVSNKREDVRWVSSGLFLLPVHQETG